MLRPSDEYARLAAVSGPPSWIRALSRPALVALILGATASTAGTGLPDVVTVAGSALCWSFVPALQVLTGVAIMRISAQRPIDVRRGLELLFAAHGPWSLWVIACAAAVTASPSLLPLDAMLATSILPGAWTSVLLFAFCVQVLGNTRRAATWRTAAHQIATWALILGYIFVATQLWPRILGAIER